MGKQSLDIRYKNPVLVSAEYDDTDLNNEVFVEGTNNIDLNKNMFIKPIKAESVIISNTDVTKSIRDGYLYPREDNTYDIIASNGSDAVIMENMYNHGTMAISGINGGTGIKSIESYITNYEQAYLSVNNNRTVKWIGKAKKQFRAFIREFRGHTINNVLGVQDFDIDSTEPTALNTVYIKIQSSIDTINFVESEVTKVTVGNKYNRIRITKTTTGIFSGVNVGDKIDCDIAIEDDGGGYHVIGLHEVLEIDSIDGKYITLDIEQTLSRCYGDIELPGNLKFGHAIETVPTIFQTMEFNKWIDIDIGLKIRFNTLSGWKNDDEWQITIEPYVETLFADDAELLTDKDNVQMSFEYKESIPTVFSKGTYYHYGFSMQYLNEESPIYESEVHTIAFDSGKVEITVNIDPANINRRVTGINIYGASGSSRTERNLWRLIKQFDFNIGHYRYIDSNTYQVIIISKGNWLESYQARTGIADNIESTMVKYRLSTVLNDTLFIADTERKEFDTNLMLFKSKVGKYCTFDWTTDFLKLPSFPIAIASYNGRIWVFTDGQIYKINYDLYIEDITDGIGCSGNKNVTVTDYGMFWHDKNGAYQAIGNKIIDISRPIKNINPSFNNVTQVLYNHANRSVCFFMGYKAYIYNVEKKSWMYIDILSDVPDNIYSYINGAYGDTFISYDKYEDPDNKYKFAELFTGNELTCNIVTKRYDFDRANQKKKYYEFLYNGTIGSVEYSLDNSIFLSATFNNNYYIISGKAKTLQLKINDITKLESFSIIYRQMIGEYV